MRVGKGIGDVIQEAASADLEEDLVMSWNCHSRSIKFDLSKICHSPTMSLEDI